MGGHVTVAVVNYEGGEQLAGCLDSLLAQTHTDLDIVVIDNASTDGSVEAARTRPEVRLVANPANRGYAGGANQALDHAVAAGSVALAVCNPDVVLDRDHLGNLLAALEEDDRRASVQGLLWRSGVDGPPSGSPPALAGGQEPTTAPRIIDTTGHVAFTTRLFRNRGEGEVDTGAYGAGPVFGVSGAAALYRVAALADVTVDGEVFDTDLFAFWEDVDIDWRLRLRGWHAHHEPAATGWHERGGAGARRSAFVEELNFANRFLVVAKNDDAGALARAMGGVTLTTLLKTAELGLTVPTALLRGMGRARLVPRALRKRRHIHATAVLDPAEVVREWFGPFDYGAWVRTWRARVRSERR